MATIERFEDLECWQLARRLARDVYEITKHGRFARDYDLRSQVRRAVVSILSNIAEGFERDGQKEFLQFLSMAKGSTGEVRAQLYVALDQAYIDDRTFRTLADQATHTGRVIAGLMRYLRRSKHKGLKYRPTPNDSS